MLDLVFVFRIILVAVTGLTLIMAFAKRDKGIDDWQVIVYLLAIFIYIIMR